MGGLTEITYVKRMEAQYFNKGQEKETQRKKTYSPWYEIVLCLSLLAFREQGGRKISHSIILLLDGQFNYPCPQDEKWNQSQLIFLIGICVTKL